MLRSALMAQPGPLPRLLVVLGLLARFGAGQAAAASMPPELRFRSLSTQRVTVHFPQELEAMARQAAALATEILERLQARYDHRVGRVQIVLVDVEDDPNGFASPLPYPLVQVRAAAPRGADEFGNHESWLRVVLTHELAHVVHLDQARGLQGVSRKVLGRAPFLFPNGATPTWMIEGLATFEETEGTAFGRGRNPDSRMVLRMAALEGDFPMEDRPVLGLDDWPGGQAAYLFGEAFLRDVSRRFGPQTIPELTRVHAGRPIPYLDDLTARSVTGRSFHSLWREWRQATREGAFREARVLRDRELTPFTLLTTRGIRQTGPRFSPDGTWIAYTSKRQTRFREIRLMRRDGTGDHRLAVRNGGSALAWTPDGRSLVYDEPESYRLFRVRSDLRRVDVETGEVRRLTRGLRAREPDVAPDGRRLVFVRQGAEASELALIGLDGSAARDLTRSAPGVQWSNPRFAPGGAMVAASRYQPGGRLDLVLVDAESGEVTPLTEDRAKDVEPVFTPDGSHLVFRSDRDGVSNLYALRLSDRALLRITNVLGGAFLPDLSPDGRTLAFASYSSRGYDLATAPLDLEAAAPAEPFLDPYPAPRVDPAPVGVESRPYRAFPTALPRFWSPYFDSVSDETRLGVLTAAADPLFRHLYGGDLYHGSKTGRLSGNLYYQYDRWLPTFLLALKDARDPGPKDAILHTRELQLRASVPLQRSLRSVQSLSLGWRRSRETSSTDPTPFDLGGIELAWNLSSVKKYPYSISPLDGSRLRLALLKEDPALGSRVSLAKLYGDARLYARLFGESDTLALRAGGGATFGRPTFQKSYAVGGIESRSLFDVAITNHSVLRGYPDDAFTGRSFAHLNLEYRFPLLKPQRGFRSYPVFLRHLHGAAFLDAAHAWTRDFAVADVKTAAGVALGADFNLAHGLPFTATAGVAHGFATRGGTRAYFLGGLAF
ncbi:MAG TPA: BamA/TamA family outer membrane protein [Vicinamibacteria bacterium]|nr:BamA/TamA family outer membrane protein [Vicinamibacteria bacterium]